MTAISLKFIYCRKDDHLITTTKFVPSLTAAAATNISV